MIILRGIIKINEGIILEDATFHIVQQQNPYNEQRSWNGWFTIPATASALIDRRYKLEEEGPFGVTLEDGRSGEFNVRSYSTLTPGSQVHFVGTGSLK